MLNATSETAVRAVIYLALHSGDEPVSPTEIAEEIGASPSYLAKIAGLLVKGGILRSQRGAWGGVALARNPATITLLDIVQACQGLLIANYCQALGTATSPEVCNFHQAMFDVHSSTIKVLTKWTVAMLAAKPTPSGSIQGNTLCRMFPCGLECSNLNPSERKRERVSTVVTKSTVGRRK